MLKLFRLHVPELRFWKIKKKNKKEKQKIEIENKNKNRRKIKEKYMKENRREKTWSIRILIKMEMQLW